MKIKAILFDYGRVLSDFDYSIGAKELKKYSPFSEGKIKDKLTSGKLVRDYHRGKISSKEFYLGIKKAIKGNKELTLQKFKKAWISVVSSDSTGVEKIFSELSPEIKYVLISDNNAWHWSKNSKLPVIRKYFSKSKLVLSHELGFEKPSKVIFKKALSVCNASAEETVFIDDNEKSLNAFSEMGGHSILFDSRKHSVDYLIGKLGKLKVTKNELRKQL